MNSKIDYLKKYLPPELLEDGLKKLEKGIPVQYIVGHVDFRGHIINVDDRVLIPRFETELLVDKIINRVNKKYNDINNLEFLDIGTGSGCIAISLSKELGGIVSAVDISDDALDVAKLNAVDNNVNINFIKSDIFSNVSGNFDVIVSNPPYISEDEEIEEVVKINEPHLALYAKNNGLYFYDKILSECGSYLKDNFLIAFEIGYLQAEDIKKMVCKYLGDVMIEIEKDYSDKDRFIFITNKLE